MVDFHTHKTTTADGVKSIRSLSIHEILNLPLLPPHFSIGVHPWYIDQTPENWETLMLQYATQPQCLMIGEAGLDKLRGPELSRQVEILKRQIFISEQIQKPLILHIVKTADTLLQLHTTLNPTQQWYCHGFNGSPQLAEEFLRHHIGLSFGARLLTSEKLQETYRASSAWAAAHHCTDLIQLETDDSPVTIQAIYKFSETLLKQ